ncbi:Fic family protein [Enterococcus faecalis]|uniref:Fic family protein n=1 Tax=Enterococcus faecalis TaxID=1351 RepID=UPI001CE3A44C|nr:Fic family protein [Enterococcus faecalis]
MAIPIKGVEFLPPLVTTEEAVKLYKKCAEVNRKIGKLNADMQSSIVNTSLFQILSFQESVQSTRIEGTQVTFSDIIDEANRTEKSDEVQEVENYRKALQLGVSFIEAGNPITTRIIKEIHSVLMSEDVRGTCSSKGEFRRIQNYIGPKGCTEKNASYIPVSANLIPEYMTNLEYYINGEEHSSFFVQKKEEGKFMLDKDSDPLIKTAVLHAQFESIHPFLDGNGRTGRILIVLNTLKDGLMNQPVFFVSEELEKEKIRYYNALNGIRGEDADWFTWLDFFLEASNRMAENQLEKLERIDQLAKDGCKFLNEAGFDSTIRYWLLSFSNLYISAREAAEFLKVSPSTARKHLNILTDLNMLHVDKQLQRNKIYINYDLLREID